MNPWMSREREGSGMAGLGALVGGIAIQEQVRYKLMNSLWHVLSLRSLCGIQVQMSIYGLRLS